MMVALAWNGINNTFKTVSYLQGKVMQIEKAVINDPLRAENLKSIPTIVFQLYIILQYFTREIC